jgi:hypothetical protein
MLLRLLRLFQTHLEVKPALGDLQISPNSAGPCWAYPKFARVARVTLSKEVGKQYFRVTDKENCET